ncbi:MAG: hypothetical protein ACJ72D_09700 [Marmoricola sp.]
MGALKKLVDGLRGSAGPAASTFQRVGSLYGSAYAPAPPELPVPEELRRAVAEEELRASRERTAAERAGLLWGVTPRLARRITRDFPDAATASEVARVVTGAANWERVQAAIVLPARGDLGSIREGAELAGTDWRDVLVNGGLADDDWPSRLDSELGPS